MARSIDYYFTLVSPWAYIGHRPFVEIARRHEATIVYRPVSLGTIFPESGGLPLAKRHPLRQRYRSLELQRWRERRGLNFHLNPAHWPFEPTLVDCVVQTLAVQGADVEAFLPDAFETVWERQGDLKDEGTIRSLLSRAGVDAEAVLRAASAPEAKAKYEAATQAALDAGIFGSPSYVLNGEVFWGQDRLELLDDALASGRDAFRA